MEVYLTCALPILPTQLNSSISAYSEVYEGVWTNPTTGKMSKVRLYFILFMFLWRVLWLTCGSSIRSL